MSEEIRVFDPLTQIKVFDFENKNQAAFYDDVMNSVFRKPGYDFRYFFYGGAIRGGKTYVCLFIFWMLAKYFPKSRWHIFRDDNPALEDTTIPSMRKLIGYTGKNFHWYNGKGSVQVRLDNGSTIFFQAESIKKDKNLDRLLGLETNGIFIEQMESTTALLLERAIERAGSHYIDPMPIPLVLGTFNPTAEPHVKKKIYDKWMRGELESPWYFREALPSDNPHVTEEQWKSWGNMDEESQARMIRGEWKFESDSKLFAYGYDEKKHRVDIMTPAGRELMKETRLLPLNLVFDFNVDPMTCLVIQRAGMMWIKVIDEYRLRSSDIFELLNRIVADYPDRFYLLNADASGRARNALTKGNRSAVVTIKRRLRLTPGQIQMPKRNPSIKNTRVLINSLFKNFPGQILISSACKFFINDLENVKTDDLGNIDKKTNKLLTHLLDNWRYFCWQYYKTFVPFYEDDHDKKALEDEDDEEDD